MVDCKYCGEKMSILTNEIRDSKYACGVIVNLDYICEKCDSGLSLAFTDGETIVDTPPLDCDKR